MPNCSQEVEGKWRGFPADAARGNDLPSLPFGQIMVTCYTANQITQHVLTHRPTQLEQINFEIVSIPKFAFRGKTCFSPDARRACVPARERGKQHGCIATYPRHFVAAERSTRRREFEHVQCCNALAAPGKLSGFAIIRASWLWRAAVRPAQGRRRRLGKPPLRTLCAFYRPCRGRTPGAPRREHVVYEEYSCPYVQ